MISPLIVLLSVCAIFYLILTLQMADGFPAFYEKGQDSREVEIHRMTGICFQLMVTMLLMVMSAILMPSFRVPLLAVLGAQSGWHGWQTRKLVQQRTSGPSPWLLTPLTTRAFNRWPMLVFDVWTFGICAVVASLFLV